IVIGYESTPTKKIIAKCDVIEKLENNDLSCKVMERFSSPISYDKIKATIKGASKAIKSRFCLSELTKDEYEIIRGLIHDANKNLSTKNAKYDVKNFLEDVYVSEKEYTRMVSVLKHKKNIILQGAPGVGKTFAAKRLAYAIMGEKDDDRIEFVQFHQSYSYEDFMMGYKPAKDGFTLTKGIFYNFCKKASENPKKDFFFIIDELNRGNISKIFGELLMLIENDHRGEETKLVYTGELFSVPENLRVIGTMNTADRSLAMIDYALRRRFCFINMEPAFDSDGFKKYAAKLNNAKFTSLIEKIKKLNGEISADASLGKGFCIGHSYFCNWEKCTDEKMLNVVDCEILPMLAEYWFDADKKYQDWVDSLHGIFEDGAK
ncbi:MAG: AAA family ATPase, partial [Porphyromonadaceae bacterium]|nr:AAA family ATPase [Porphyromonadaceae bacterium]